MCPAQPPAPLDRDDKPEGWAVMKQLIEINKAHNLN